MRGKAVRREPLTPRNRTFRDNVQADPVKGAVGQDGLSNPSEAPKVPASAASFADSAMEENEPENDPNQPARSEPKPRDKTASGEPRSSRRETVSTPLVSPRNAHFSRLQADLEMREYQMLNQQEMSRHEIREYAEAAQRAKSNELLLQKKLHDMEVAMQAEIVSLKMEHAQALQRQQQGHDEELDELQLQTAEDTMQDIMTKVTRLQAAIAEAAAQVGITVSWCPPSFANTGMQEEFEEMGAWLSRMSDNLHELSRERRRLKEAHREEAQRRREVQAELFDLQGPVQVLCRLHNQGDSNSDGEVVAQQDCPVNTPTPQTTGRPVHDAATPNRVKVNSNRYNFQTVLAESDGHEELFEELEPTVLSVLDGHNVCILSHELMESSTHATLRGSDVDSGLSARCAEALFEAAAADPSLTSARLHVSFVEVTESEIYDIMASNPQGRGGKQDQRQPWIEIDPTSDSVEPHQQEVEDPEDAADVLQACFRHREKNCSGSKDGAQGHTLTCITVNTSNEGLETVSQLWLAGLSGRSVLAAQDGLEEDLRDLNTANCSLSALATCLAVRCQGRSNVPCSDSPLTCLLKGSLGLGSRIVLLLNLSEAGPVSTSTAASLDWMHHLQTLSTARHMSGHTLAADDSCTTAFNSMSQLHPITSPPQLTNADESPVVVEVVGSRTSLAGRVSESKSGSSAVLAVPAVLTAGQSQNEALLAEVEQLKARVQDLQGENARLHAQVSELTSKQALVQADAEFMSEYKVNSAIARHSLSARCSDLEAQLSEAKSALTHRDSCTSPTSLSKQSSKDCSVACSSVVHLASAQPSFVTAATSLPVAGSTTTSVECDALSAPPQGDNNATVKVAFGATNDAEAVDRSTTNNQVLAVGRDSLNSEPTSEDLDASPRPASGTLNHTTLDTNASADAANTAAQELAEEQPNLQATLQQQHPETLREVSEDSLIKSSSFSLQPSSVSTRQGSAAVVTHHAISAAGTFQDNTAVTVPEAAASHGRSAATAQTAATDSRLDSDLLAVLSDCPSPTLVNPALNESDDTHVPVATLPSVPPSPNEFGIPRHSYVQSGEAAPEAQRLPEVFESLDLAHYLQDRKAPAAGAAKRVSNVTVPPLLTIPVPPPRLASHKSSSASADAQKPWHPSVLDSVDLGSFIKCDTVNTSRSGQDTPRSVGVKDSMDLNAFMKAESGCSTSTAAAQQACTRVMDSADLSAFIKGEASAGDTSVHDNASDGAARSSHQWQGSGSVRVMDSIDLSNFIKSDGSGVLSTEPHVSCHVTDSFDFNTSIKAPCDTEKGAPGEESYGRLQCIAEESETPDISVSLPAAVNDSEAAGPDKEGTNNDSEAPPQPSLVSSVPVGPTCEDPSALCQSEPNTIEHAVSAEVTPPAASEAASSDSKVPDTVLEQPASVRPTADAAQQLQPQAHNDTEQGILHPFTGQPEDQTISLAPAIASLQHQHQVTPILRALGARSALTPMEGVATDRLLCDSSEGADCQAPAAQHYDAIATDGHGWGGAERLDQDFDVDDDDADGRMSTTPNSGEGNGSGSGSRSLRLSLGRAGEGLRGLFGRKGEQVEPKPFDRRWTMSETTREHATPRGVTPRGVTPRRLTPRQSAAGDDGSGGGVKTPRSVLGSRASIDKLMRSAFKRSTTLLASARNKGRRQHRPDHTVYVPEEAPAMTLLDAAHLPSCTGSTAGAGHATPKKLDFTSKSATLSPDVNASTKSLQSTHSNSEISPVLGFINPATVEETAQDAGLTPWGTSCLTTAAAASRSKLQQDAQKHTTTAPTKSGSMQQPQHESAPINQEIFSASAAVAAAPLAMSCMPAVRATSPCMAASAAQPASRLPRSPVVNKNSARGASKSSFLSPTPTNDPENAAAGNAVPSTVSALPRSPFDRLKAALQSQRRQLEQDERAATDPHTMPARAPVSYRQHDTMDDSSRGESQIESAYTACIDNPHFNRHAATSTAVGSSSGPLQSLAVTAHDHEDNDDVLRGSVSLPLGPRTSPPATESSGNTLLLAHDIAPRNASYAWLVNGPSALSSQHSHPTLSTAVSGPAVSRYGEREHHSQPAHSSSGAPADRPRTSPLPQPVPSAIASLHNASTTDINQRLHTAPSLCEGASAPLLSHGDGNPTEIVRNGRNGAGELNNATGVRSKGSYWRRGAPLRSSHKGTAGYNGGSSRGSSPGEFRSVSPPLPERMQPSFVSRQFPSANKDQSLLAASASASNLAKHTYLQNKLRTAPVAAAADGQARDRSSEDEVQAENRRGCTAEEKSREEKGKEAYARRMRELQEHTASFHTPAPMLRDSSSLMTPSTSQKKPPGRVSHAKAAQQMAKANADHKRMLAAASAGGKRKSKAWM